MAVHAYRIGVHLAMTNGVSGAIGVIAGQMLGLQRQINGAALGFNALTTAIAGAGLAWAGAGLVAGVGAMVRAGSELVRQQSLLRMAGEDNLTVARATAAAWETAARVRGTTAAENLRTVGELRSLVGSTQEAISLLPHFAQFQRVLSAVTGQRDERAGDFAARLMDARGAIRFENGQLDERRFRAEMNALQAATINNRGRVSPEQMFLFQQRARTAGINLSPEAMYGDMSVLIETMGGNVAGTALQAANRQMVGGIMPVRQADLLRAAGIIEGSYERIRPQDRRRIAERIYQQEGTRIRPAETVQLGERAVRGVDLMQSGQWVSWVTSVLMPAMDRWMQRTEGRDATDADRQRLISQWFSTGPAQAFFSQIVTSLQQIERERRMQADIRANPERAVREMNANNPAAAMQSLSAAWSNLMTAIGSPIVPDAVRAMNMLADGIDYLTAAIVKRPAAARALLGLAAGVGAAMVVIGVVAVAAAAIGAIGGGAVAGTILAVSAAIGVLAAVATQVNWSLVLSDLRSSFTQMGQWFAGIGTAIWQWGKDAFTGAGNIIREAVRAFRADVAEVWTGITAFFSRAGQIVSDAVQAFMTDADAAWTWITALFTGAASVVQEAVRIFRAEAEAAWTWITALFTGAAEAIASAVEDFRAAAQTAWDGAIATIRGWATQLFQAVESFRAEAMAAIRAIIEWVTSLPRRVIEGLTGRTEGLGVPANPMGDQGATGGATTTPLPGGASPSNFVPTHRGGDTVIHVPVTLDGRVLTDVVTRHQGRDAQAPVSAAPRFDRRQAPLLPDGLVTA